MQVIAQVIARFALLALCAAADYNPDVPLVYYDAIGNQTLDPQEPQNNSSFAQGVLMAVYEPLVRLDEKGDPKPGLAESWSYNEDLTVLTLRLRPAQNGARSSCFSSLPAADSGSASRNSTLRGHL